MKDKDNDTGKFGKSKNAFFQKRGSQASIIHHPKDGPKIVDDGEQIAMSYLSREVNDIFMSIFARYEKITKLTHEKEFEELNLK